MLPSETVYSSLYFLHNDLTLPPFIPPSQELRYRPPSAALNAPSPIVGQQRTGMVASRASTKTKQAFFLNSTKLTRLVLDNLSITTSL